MRDLLKKEMIKLGYSADEVEADINAMSDPEVEQMCKDMNIYAQSTTAKVRKAREKPKHVSPRARDITANVAKKPFDPVAEAMRCITQKKPEEKPVLQFTDTPCKWKRTIVSEMSAELERAVTAEMESHGGKRVGFGVYEFDRNPETYF